MVKNPPQNVGDVGSIPSWGTENSHALEQLSPRVAITELVHSGAQALQLESPDEQ